MMWLAVAIVSVVSVSVGWELLNPGYPCWGFANIHTYVRTYIHTYRHTDILTARTGRSAVGMRKGGMPGSQSASSAPSSCWACT